MSIAMKNKNPKAGDVCTLAGVFKANTIYTLDGEKFDCCTYGRVQEVIEGKAGIFNLRYNTDVMDWIIFQYLLMENNEELLDTNGSLEN
jgi:hypothetical protein